MAKRLVWTMLVLMALAGVRQALALGEVVSVTRQTQAKLGLEYTLTAERVDDEAVLVRMEIPRTGKLKDLRSVSMRVGSGRPKVSATLQTSAGKDGSWVVAFQLSPALADECSVDLVVPSSGRTYVVYAVELKGYVSVRK